MSEKKIVSEDVAKFRAITKLSGMDYFLIILATVFLLILYLALYFKSDMICGYILPIGYIATAIGFMVVFVKQVFGMNKKMDAESEDTDKENQ